MFLRPIFGERGTGGSRPVVVRDRDVVFLLHGICKTSLDMMPMERALKQEGYKVVNWGYASRKYSLDEIADQLAEKLKEYEGRRVHFVTHSMGGIVVRRYLSKFTPTNCGRFVMIAPPNTGALLADFFGDWMLYKFIFGPAGQQLRQGEKGACLEAGKPPCDFAIIAGGTGKEKGMNPLIPGDNDGTISVESTKLEGASDFMLLPYHHPYIQYMPLTIHNAMVFLETGRFCDKHEDEQFIKEVENRESAGESEPAQTDRTGGQ